MRFFKINQVQDKDNERNSSFAFYDAYFTKFLKGEQITNELDLNVNK